jgi:predicted permease
MRWQWWKSGSFGKREQDLAREIEAHLRAEADEQRAEGISEAEGRDAARRLFGNVGQAQEDAREAWGLRWVERLWQDLRFGARGLRRNPGYALVIVLSLALGIGANSAIFSVLNAVLLRPLPVVSDPEQLFELDISESKFWAPQGFSYPLFERMRQVAPSGVAAMTRVARMYGRIDGQGERDIERVQLVSGEYFDVLGLSPSRGRFIAPGDNLRIGDHPVAVVSHAFWQSRLGGSANVVGRSVDLNGALFTIVGVAPEGFHGLWLEAPVDIWIPLMMQAAAHYQQNFSSSNSDEDKPWPNQEGIRWLDLMVRTRGSLPALNGVFQRWLEQKAPDISGGADRQIFLQQRLTLDPMARGFSRQRGEIQGPLFALAAMVALVLGIAGANSASLILARGALRRREIAVRLSIGASRKRVIRQLFTETCLLVAIAFAAGLTAAYLAGGFLLRAALGTTAESPGAPASLDWRVLGFSLAVSALTAVLTGLTPALRTTDFELDVASKSGARGLALESPRRLQRFLVTAQIALVFVLLVMAGWFSSSLRYLAHLSLGYDQEHVVTAWLRPELSGIPQNQLPELHRRLVESLESVPGVESAVYAMCGLASGCRTSSRMNIAGYQPAAGEDVDIFTNFVGPHYFTTVGMRLLTGRGFTERDSEKAPAVTVVNQALVRRYFPDGNAIGRRLGYGTPSVEIVGVVEDARVNSEREAAEPMAFFPLAQGTVFGGCVEVRVVADPTPRMREIRQAIGKVDANLPIDSIRTVRDQVNGNLRRDRLIVWLASAFGALALGLGCMGIYGTMSYSVARRTSEIGIRMALGAAPGRMFRLAFGESLALLALGLGFGTPLIVAASRPLSKVMLGVDVNDPRIPVFAALVVIISAAAAASLPARRASRVDPMVALRYE